ncbi:MAG TPA: hypothetical protein VJ715_17225 [Pyrinomonadaceae bacterium]|nr:hypothetical protein [Pyrinomonadaceae bacterium]
MVSAKAQSESAWMTPRVRRISIRAAVLLGVFLLGLVPVWLKARQYAGGLAETERQLRLSRMQNDLASALINARKGDYEPARQDASQFFTALREVSDKEDAPVRTQLRREVIKPLLAQRDEVITLLARNDPASADRLFDLYNSYRQLVGG